MGTAEKLASNLDPMANYFAMAVFADWCDGLNGTLKAIEDVPRTGGDQFKTLVVLVATNFTFRHSTPL